MKLTALLMSSLLSALICIEASAEQKLPIAKTSCMAKTSGVAETSGAAKAWASQPQTMLWSWKKIEDLSGLRAELVQSGRVGVAFLTSRIVIDEVNLRSYPRLGRLDFPANVYKEAVVRLEVVKLPEQKLWDEVIEKLCSRILSSALSAGRISALQIDFDARLRERQFYRQLLGRLKERVPGTIKLNMTALASWSQGDNWLEAMPADTVIPMFFTMGSGQGEALTQLKKQLPASFKGRRVIGLSVSDPAAAEVLGDRLKEFDQIYLFCSPGWNAHRLAEAGKLIGCKLSGEEK